MIIPKMKIYHDQLIMFHYNGFIIMISVPYLADLPAKNTESHSLTLTAFLKVYMTIWHFLHYEKDF